MDNPPPFSHPWWWDQVESYDTPSFCGLAFAKHLKMTLWLEFIIESVIATWFLMEAPSLNQVTKQPKVHGIRRETEVVIRNLQIHDDLSVPPGAPCKW